MMNKVPNSISTIKSKNDIGKAIELVIGQGVSVKDASESIKCTDSILRHWIEMHYYNNPKRQRRIEIMVLQSKINEI